ncbi:MAG: PilZ domain-containing protein [Armatimonadetes bacterium]|nr:PilZ domain-containing protein [Armatimonadota bacterium]
MANASEDYRATALEVLQNLKDKTAASRASGATFEERRRLIRLKCSFEVTCRDGDRTFPAHAHDVSLGGMRLESRELHEGLEMKVRPRDGSGDWIRARVMWYSPRMGENGSGGVQFQEPPQDLGKSWVVDLLHRLGLGSSNFINRRKYTRARADLPASVRCGEERREGKVLDIGLGGAMLELDGNLETGDLLELQIPAFRNLPELDLPGRVLAAREAGPGRHHHHLQFEELDPDTTRALGRVVVELLRSPG